MKLPKFLFKHVAKHQTSLGNNLAFPPETDYPFDYKVLKKRMGEVVDEAQNMFGEDIDVLKAQNLLSQYLIDVQRIEEPIKEQLINVCTSVIGKMFTIPKETIQIECKLVNKIQPKHSFRILPEEFDGDDFSFEDLNEMSDVNKVILKRRFINSLIQGGSYRYAQLSDFYIDEFEKLNLDLPQLYKKIIILNDFLLFNKKENISDKNPKQGAVVEVELGREGEKTIINVQGTNFIFLLNETIRGFFELFASHGLPSDNKKANYIIHKADFLLAEPWDLRMGVGIWDLITKNIEDTKLMPYFFTKLCEKPVDEFNEQIQEILANTKKGEEIVEHLIKESEKEFEMMNIHSFIQDKNNDETLINDSYFSSEDFDEENYDIIEEECFTEEELDDDILLDDTDEKVANILINASFDQIDFNEKEISVPRASSKSKRHLWDLQIMVDGVKIPSNLASLWAESVSLGGKMFYQLHIRVDEKLRRKGIAFKLYKAFINIFGHAISLYNNRTSTYFEENGCATTNDSAIEQLWKKLGQDPTIKVSTINYNKQPIGVIGRKK